MEADIRFREGAGGEWQNWATRVGTLKEIRATARGLLRDLRAEDRRSQVRIVFKKRTERVRL